MLVNPAMMQRAAGNDFEKIVPVASVWVVRLKFSKRASMERATLAFHGLLYPRGVFSALRYPLMRNWGYSFPRLPLHESGLDLLGVVQPAGGLLLWGGEGAHGFSGMVTSGDRSARRQRAEAVVSPTPKERMTT